MFSSKQFVLVLVAVILVSEHASAMQPPQSVLEEANGDRQARGFVNYPCSGSGTCSSGQYCGDYNATVGFSMCQAKKCFLGGCKDSKECSSGSCILGLFCGPCIGCC